MEERYHRHNPSFFFPIALITVGIIWLMVTNNMISVENIYRLLPLWPVLVIAAGVSILLRRLWWPLGGLMWAALAALLIWSLVAAPGLLPRIDAAEVRHDTLSEPVDKATSATVRLDLSIYRTNVHALANDNNLILADLYVINNVNLNVSGTDTKDVQLREGYGEGPSFWSFNWLGMSSKPWDIGLTTKIPLALDINAGTGSTDLNLTSLNLQSLKIDAATGSLDVRLPEGAKNLPVRLNGATGRMTIVVPQNTGSEMTINGGTGSLTINLPSDAGVRVDVRSGGLGSLNLSPVFKKISGGDSKQGLYETEGFSTAKNPITITLDIGTGSVTIH